jgi:DNA replication protein DnaC
MAKMAKRAVKEKDQWDRELDQIDFKGLTLFYTALTAYCDKFPAVKTPNLVFSGATGTGKTFTAQVMANILLDRGVFVHYTTAFAMVNAFQKFVQSFGADTDAIDTFLECDVLIIDDLGAEPTLKNITQEHIYNIINERLLHNRAFIVTTNLSPSDIVNRYDQRISSRILAQGTSALLEFAGKDLRMK